MRELSEEKQAVLRIAKKAYREKLMAGTSGNMSIFIPSDRETDVLPAGESGEGRRGLMIITPSSYDYEIMEEKDIVVTDLEGNVIARWDQYSSAYINYEGSVYAFVYGDSTSDAYYDLDGNQLPARGQYGYFQGDYFCVNGDDATTVTDLEGNVIFRWPIYSADD